MKTATNVTASNKLAAYLETGKKVQGLKGYVGIEHSNGCYCDNDETPEVFVLVEVLKLITSEEDCGLKVLVKPYAGQGSFKINPQEWFDTPAAISEKRDLLDRQRKAKDEYEAITSHHFAHKQRLALESYVALLPKHAHDAIKIDLKENNLKIETLTLGQIVHYARAAVCTMHSLMGDNIPHLLRKN